MKRPAHIKVAEKNGPQAGMESLHDYLTRNTNDGTNGLDTNRAMLKALRRAGGYRKTDETFAKPEKAVAWYCNHFNKKFGTAALLKKGASASHPRRVNRGTTQPEQVETTTDAVNVLPLIQAAIAAGATPEQLAAIVNAATGSDHEVEDGFIQVENDDTGDNGETAPTPVTTYPGPRDPDADATNGKLWTLNTEGPEFGYFLCVIDGDGNIVAGGDESLKNGECHELIAEIRAA